MAKELKVAVSLDLREARKQMKDFVSDTEKSLQGLQAAVRGGGSSATAQQAATQAQQASRGGGGARGAFAGARAGLMAGRAGGGAAAVRAATAASARAGIVGGLITAGIVATQQIISANNPGGIAALAEGANAAKRVGIRAITGGDGVSESGAANTAIDRAKGSVAGMIQNAPDIGQDQINDLLGAYQKIYEPGQRNLQRLGVGVDEAKAENALSIIRDIRDMIRSATGL